MVLTSALVFFYFRDYMNALLKSGRYYHKNRMSKAEAEKCMEWLFQQQEEIARSQFGRGKSGVLEALAIHHSKVKGVLQVKGQVEDLRESEMVGEKALDALSGMYESVKALCDNRKSNLDLISQIAGVEDQVQSLSSEINARAMFLVSSCDVKHDQLDNSVPNEMLARTDQASIISARENWKWIFQLLQCAEVHLRNAAAYQGFFQEAETAEYWMNATLANLHPCFDRSQILSSSFDLQSFLKEINDILIAYMKWQTKIDYLFDKSRHVVPVPLRVKPLTSPLPVLALTDYKTNEIEFSEGDTLTLLDNSDKKKWTVQTEHGQTGVVLAVVFLMTPPYSAAIDFALKLRLQLLSLWTSTLRYLGFKLITIMLLVIRNWTEEEIKLLQAMTFADKQILLRILTFIEETLLKNWRDYGDYRELQSRIIKLRLILQGSLDQNGGNSFCDSLVVQMKGLEGLLNKYMEFWSFWETFKCVAEMLKNPRFMLVCDKWDQLKFVTSADFVKFWDTHLDLTGFNTCDEGSGEMIRGEATIAEKMEETTANTIEYSSEGKMSKEMQETTTDTVTSTLEEEQHTFIVKAVLDPRDERTQLAVEEAIRLGILDESQKHYKNPKTGKVITLIDAMNEGKVQVEFISKKKIREENKSYGLITITITKEMRPYTITGVIDPATDEKLSISQAVSKNILDSSCTTYRMEKGELLPIVDAINSALVLVDYQGSEIVNEAPEVITKTYLVSGVVDQKKKDKVSFAEAVQDGLLSRDTGEYVNNVTFERMPAFEAIRKGLIKGRIANDPSKLEINAENKIVVERLTNAKNKLLQSFKSAKAFGK